MTAMQACEGHPERDRDSQHAKPRHDHKSADDNDGQGQRETPAWSGPPQVERIDAVRAEQHEAQHQPDVRRVEDVFVADAKDMLRDDRDRSRRGEDPGSMQAPPLAMLRAGDPEDQRHAAPVSNALAGHSMTPRRPNVITTSSTAAVTIAVRICAIEMLNPKTV